MDIKSDVQAPTKRTHFGKYFLLSLVLVFGISLVGIALLSPQVTGFVAIIVFFVGLSQVEYVVKYIMKDNK